MTRYTHKANSVKFSNSPDEGDSAAARQSLALVSAGAPPITITSVYDDYGSVQGNLTPYSDHETSDDRTLTIAGTLSAPLGSGERIEIIDAFNSNSVVGVATVSGDRWTVTTSPLAIGFVGLSARIVGANGSSRAEEFFWAGKIEDESAVLPSPTLTSVLGYSQDFGTGEAADVITNGDVTTAHAFMLSGTTDLAVRVQVSVDGGATFLDAQTNGNAGPNLTNWTFYTYLPAGVHDIIVRGSNGAGQYSETVPWHFTISNQLIGEDNTNDTFAGYRTDSEFFDVRLGDDTVRAGDGNDTLLGGGGNDLLLGQQGKDNLVGGEGNDDLKAGQSDDTVVGGSGDDTVFGGNDNDLIYGDGQSTDPFILVGGNDSVFGGIGEDTIYGGGGNDWIAGGRNTPVYTGESDFPWDVTRGDLLFGGAGDDVLTNANLGFGTAGSDTLVGALDNDTILLQQGFFGVQTVSFDNVVYNGQVRGQDVILGFQGDVFDSRFLSESGYAGPEFNAPDLLDLRGLLSDLHYAADATVRKAAITVRDTGEISTGLHFYDLFVDTNTDPNVTNNVLIARIGVTTLTISSDNPIGDDNLILV